MSKMKNFLLFMNMLLAMLLAALLGVCIAVGAAKIVGDVQAHFCVPRSPKDAA